MPNPKPNLNVPDVDGNNIASISDQRSVQGVDINGDGIAESMTRLACLRQGSAPSLDFSRATERL